MSTTKDLFPTCQRCVVKKWCKLRRGEVKLPDNRLVSFCSGYDLLEKALQLANVSEEYRDANRFHYDFDGIDEETKLVIQNMLDRPVDLVRNGVSVTIIHPNKGTGKTYLANAILNEFLYKVVRDPEWFDYERPVAFYQKFGLWANTQRNVASFNDPEYSYKANKLNKTMMEVPLLVVDDIGSGRITPFIRDLFYDIVDWRKEHKKATIYTSNFPLEELEKDDMLGEMIVSRMLYKNVDVSLGGRDRRRDN